MNDPKTVIKQLSKRWLASYGETLGTEDIRRHMTRILNEIQKREIEQVFANWSGEDLLAAIEATFDLDDGNGVVRTDDLASGLCPPSEPIEPVGDTEYLPVADAFPDEINLPVKRKGGRPPGSKNKGKRL